MDNATAAILDYIMTTPENFNPNLFREFLTNEDALNNLVMAYQKKISQTEESSLEGPGGIEFPMPLNPGVGDGGGGNMI